MYLHQANDNLELPYDLFFGAAFCSYYYFGEAGQARLDFTSESITHDALSYPTGHVFTLNLPGGTVTVLRVRWYLIPSLSLNSSATRVIYLPSPASDSHSTAFYTTAATKAVSTHVISDNSVIYPETPGFESAFAYSCLQDPSAYAAATKLLDRMDRLVQKMILAESISELNKIWINTDADASVLLYSQKSEAGKERELGWTGLELAHTRLVLQARDPGNGVELRHKMSMLYHILKWLPLEVHRRAGVCCATNDCLARVEEPQLNQAAIQLREQKVTAYIERLGMSSEVSASGLANYFRDSASAAILRFHFGPDGQPDTTGRATNTLFFEPRPDQRRDPWTEHASSWNLRQLELVRHDPEHARCSREGRLAGYEPAFETVESNALTGTSAYVLNADGYWYTENKQGPNRMVMTGPSGTTSHFLTHARIFGMSVKQRQAGVRALIGHMLLDWHHSLSEAVAGIDADPELRHIIRYDGSIESLRTIGDSNFDEARAMCDKFMVREIKMRNHLEATRRTVLPVSQDKGYELGASQA